VDIADDDEPDEKHHVDSNTGTPVRVILGLIALISIMVISGASILQGTIVGNIGILLSMFLVKISA